MAQGYMRLGVLSGAARTATSSGAVLTSSPSCAAADIRERFFVAAREQGQERSDLPVWTAKPDAAVAAFDLFQSETSRPTPSHREVEGLPGGFQILDLLSPEECRAFVNILDTLGFHEDAAVSLPYSFRHMANCNLVVPEGVDGEFFERCKHLLPDVGGCPPLGINAKFRCYRYGGGDYFKPHTDGAWPGSRCLPSGSDPNGSLQFVSDAYGDRLSQYTFLLLLTDDYKGGETRFVKLPGGADVTVRTPMGGALCFPHGYHPDSPLHEGMPVFEGFKYMIRTEVLYSLEALRSFRSA